jgi:hypothetical protein
MPTDKPKETGVMSEAEEVAELRRWLRQDARDLHAKIDKHADENAKAHALLGLRLNEMDKANSKKIAGIETTTAVIATKIGLVVTLIMSVVLTVIHKFMP